MSYHERVGGASRETIISVIERRVGAYEMDYLNAKYGRDAVRDALNDAAEMHYGCEEIGSSDAYYMVESFRGALPKEV